MCWGSGHVTLPHTQTNEILKMGRGRVVVVQSRQVATEVPLERGIEPLTAPQAPKPEDAHLIERVHSLLPPGVFQIVSQCRRIRLNVKGVCENS